MSNASPHERVAPVSWSPNGDRRPISLIEAFDALYH
jgi:hypothetical protein